MTSIKQGQPETKLLGESEIARLKDEIMCKENELNELRLALGKAVIKFENHKDD